MKWSPKKRTAVKLTVPQYQWLGDFFAEIYHNNFPSGAKIVAITASDNDKLDIKFAEGATESDRDNFESVVQKYEAALNENIELPNSSRLFTEKRIYFSPDFSDDAFNGSTFYGITSHISFDEIQSRLLQAHDRTTLTLDLGEKTPSKSYYRIATGKYADVPAFTTKGLALINYYHGLKNTFICANDNVFLNTLELLKRSDLPESFDLMLVRCFPDGHVQPIKIERRKGINNITLIDSAGRSKGYLKSTLEFLEQNLPESSIHYTDEPRQTDDFSCYTVTAKDLVKMGKQDRLYLEMRDEASTVKESESVFKCAIPERFFSLVQSRTFLSKFTGRAGYKSEATFIKKASDGTTTKETLTEKIYRPRKSGYKEAEVKTPYFEGEEEIPAVIDHFARKYAQVIDRILVEHSPDQLRQIFEDQDASKLTVEKLFEISKVKLDKEIVDNKRTMLSPKSEGYLTPKAAVSTVSTMTPLKLPPTLGRSTSDSSGKGGGNSSYL